MALRPRWVAVAIHSQFRFTRPTAPATLPAFPLKLLLGENSDYIIIQKPELGHSLLKPWIFNGKSVLPNLAKSVVIAWIFG